MQPCLSESPKSEVTQATSYATGAYRAAEAQIAVLPMVWEFAGTKRGVLSFHGATAGVGALDYFVGTLGGDSNYLSEPLGIPSFWGDFGNLVTYPTSWGNDDSITAVGAAWTWMKANLGVKTDQVLLAAGSMGVIVALNWARQNPALVAALIGGIPVLDLNDIYQNNKGGYQGAIGAAYGVTYPTALPGLSTHSPVAYPADVRGFPIRLYTSDNDPIASNTVAAQAWAAAVGSNVTVISGGANGHALPADPTRMNWLYQYA